VRIEHLQAARRGTPCAPCWRMQPNSQVTKQILESKLLELMNPAGWRDSIAVQASADPTDTTQQIAEREMAAAG